MFTDLLLPDMKIGFDAKRLFFNGSGLGNYSRNTVRLLAQHAPEHKYALFTPKYRDGYGFAVTDDLEVVAPHGMRAVSGAWWRTFGITRNIRACGLDIYHGLSNELPANIAKTRVRSVVTMHDIIFVCHPELYSPIDRKLYTMKYLRSCQKADHIIAISRQTASDLINYWNLPESKISVIYQGCDPVFERRVPEKRRREVTEKYGLPERFILSVGTIEERKNLMLTVRAMVEEGLDIDLVACGRHTRYADQVMEYAASHGLGQRVRMLHSVTFDELPAIYQSASVFVYPSHYEGFGIPIIEALNSHVPVITTRGGVFAETGGDACIYVDPSDSSEMAHAIRTALDADNAREMIARGTAHARNFRESTIAENLLSLYKTLL